MPDNIKRGTQKLVDEGWKGMSAILDREMPQRKRRRGAFWIVSGVALLVLLITAMLFRDGTGELDATSSPEQTQHQADASKPESDAIAEHQLPGESDSRTADSQTITATGQSGTDDQLARSSEITQASVERDQPSAHEQVSGNDARHSDQRAAIASNEAPAHAKPSVGIPEANPPALTEQADQQPDNPSITNVANASMDISGENAQEDQPFVIEDARTLFDLTPIETLESALIIPEREVASAELHDPYRKRWTIAAFTAGHFEDAVLMHGVEGGLTLTIDLGRRTRLMTGLSYGHYRERGIWALTGQKADEFALSEQDNMDSTVTGGVNNSTLVLANEIYDNTINYDTIRILADRYNYLHLPVMLKYRVTPKLDVGFGARVSRLLSAPSEYAINAQTSSFAAGVSRDARGPNNFLYNYDILRKFDIAPMFGLSWSVGRRTAIDISYQRGLVPFVDRSGIMDRTDYHESVSVGLRVDLF